MNPEYEIITLNRNEEKKRFEINIDGYFAFIDYTQMGNAILLNHTEVDAELAGKGAATAVVEKTLHYLEGNNYELMPFCPLVFAYIKRHPEWKRIVSAKFKGFN